LVNSSTPISQQLGWQQPITPLIARQPKVVPYPPYPIWYNILPSFVPMDLNINLTTINRNKGWIMFMKLDEYKISEM
jgi:hypothetical protein